MAIFLRMCVRFLLLLVLVLWFGPHIVGLFGGVVKQHWISILVTAAAGVCLWLALRRRTADEEFGE